MGNKYNLQYRKLFSRKSAVQKENSDIFRGRLLISDPFLIIEGEEKQKLKRGSIRKKRL